jgi:hypothetical protein
MTNLRSDSFEQSRDFPALGWAITIGESGFTEG